MNKITIWCLIIFAASLVAACSTSANKPAGTGNAAANSATNTAAATKAAKGIDPAKACSVFEKAGLKAGAYEWDDKYSLASCSASKIVGPEGHQRLLSYYVSGDRTLADHLELSLPTMLEEADMPIDKKKEAEAIKLRGVLLDAMAAGGDDLAKLTTGSPLPAEAKEAIKAMKAGKWTVGDVNVEFERDDKPGMGVDLNLHFRY